MNDYSLGEVAVRRVRPANVFEIFPKSEVEQSIAARFEKQAARHRHRLALRSARGDFSYDQLNRLANRLARAINQTGRAGNGAVALLFAQDAPLIVAILAVLKAGRFYVALDASHPRERLRAIVEDSCAEIIVSDAQHFEEATALSDAAALVNFNELSHDLSEENLPAKPAPDALAYLVYTSGSTGKPKAVCQTQRNVLHNTLKYTNACHLGADDRLSLLARCSFSASISNLFGALLNGAALLPFDLKSEGVASLSVWLQAEAISVYHSVPLVFRNLAQAAKGARFPNLRLIKLGGEAITRADFDLYQRNFARDAILYIGLGSSEMNCARSWMLDCASNFEGAIAPVGYAVEETEVLLLDDQQCEVESGEVGEIAIHSPYLFPGYWRRPELDASVFVPHPRLPKTRIFRTGDLGRMRQDGLLEHLGRNEFQIKIRGARVERPRWNCFCARNRR